MKEVYRILKELKKIGAHIYVENGELNLDVPKGALTLEIAENIKSHRDEIVAFISNGSKSFEFSEIPALSETEKENGLKSGFAISDAQRRIWVLSQFEDGSVAYNITGKAYLNQEIDIEFFKSAINATIARHEILRTIFKEQQNKAINEGGTIPTNEIRQWILTPDELNFEIDYRDFRNIKAQSDEGKPLKAFEIENYITEDSLKAFDLENGPLIRAALLQTEDEEYVFYYCMHHIISDGWSMDVLSKDVFAYYEAFKENKQTTLEDLKIQYKDYSAWQIAQLNDEVFKAHRSYWLQTLKGELPMLDLPRSKKRPIIKTNNGQGITAFFDARTSAELKKYSQANGGSPFISLLASWNVLMYKYTFQKDFIIGTPIAGREHADLSNQIGFYVNTLALRNKIDPEASFNTFYAQVKENTLKGYSHQMYPFDRLVEELKLQRDTSRSAVFDVMLSYQNVEENADDGVKMDDEKINQITDQGSRTSKFDIDITFEEIKDCIGFKVIFNPDIYEPEIIIGLINHFKEVVRVLLANPEVKISEVDFLSKKEKKELLVSFNPSKVKYPDHETILDLFATCVEKAPANSAVVCRETEWTYKDLDEKSNQLANYLQKRYEIQANDLVGIKLERSKWMIVSILAVLKSGGAYVPIDPDYPEERINYIEQDASLKVCIDQKELNQFESVQKDYSKAPLKTIIAADNLAYVIYTSGSTGQPKGVLISHHSLVDYVRTFASKFELTNQDVVLQQAPISFDVAVEEIFPTLCSGSKLVIVPQGAKDIEKLVEIVEQQKASILSTVPLVVNELNNYSQQLSSLRVLISGGDELRASYISNLLGQMEIYNTYGPTESTVCATYNHVVSSEKAKFIGFPITNRSIYILDESNHLIIKGAVGEICIGGEGLAKGYLNQEALTNEKFIFNPFIEGERLYKTGDLGRYSNDGNIEFMGRKDDQVKIRGYRIELGEIEQALSKNKIIGSALVLALTGETGEKYLVAYFTAEETQTASDLRAYLSQSLPEYMLPLYYVQLDQFPVTANGKVDRKALPNPEGLGMKSGVEYVAPNSEEEKVLVSVWTDVLKRGEIGIKDSFYNLGGDSIKSIQVVSRLKQQGYSLKVEHILRTPILEELAKFLNHTVQIVDQSVVVGKVELTPIQHWFFETNEIVAHHHYNQSVLLKISEPIDRKILDRCLTELTKHHDALRMVYRKKEGVWSQYNNDTKTKSYELESHDLSESDNPSSEISQIGEKIQASISLADGPILKIVHFKLKDGDRLGLVLHHLVVDGVSWRILLEDFSALYTNFKSGQKISLPLKSDAFQKWALAQKDYANSSKLKAERKYWKKVCNQELPGLPQDKELNGANGAVDTREVFSLSAATTEILQTRVHHVLNTEVNDVLLTGLGLAIKDVLALDKVVLEMEGHGREDILEGLDVSRTVGWFTTIYPFVLNTSQSNRLNNLVGIKDDLRKVPNKGIGYGILKYLSEEGLENKLIPEIIFNYLGDFGSNASNNQDSLFEYAPEYMGASSAKENSNNAILDVSGMLIKGELNMVINYSKSRFHETTIKNLIAAYKTNLEKLIEELSVITEPRITPSDLSFKGLTIKELSRINADNNVEDIYELSPLQEGIFYHALSAKNSLIYCDQMSYRIKANGLKVENLKQAYDNLVKRHGILRTSFLNNLASIPLQVVRKDVPSNFTYESVEDQENQAELVDQIRTADRNKGFVLSSPSQMRMHIVALSNNEYEFIWSHHHILMDGWCLSVLTNDFTKLLMVQNNSSNLQLPNVIPYSNYINWLRTFDKQNSLNYWATYLKDYETASKVPFRLKNELKKVAISNKELRIEGDLFKEVDELCSQIGITQNTFFQGIWGYLLAQYNNSKDVVFGGVVSGRPAELQGVEDMIGLFINTIPVRVKYEFDDTPKELLTSLQKQAIESTSHHYINIADVQSETGALTNLIDHIFVFENYAKQELAENTAAIENKDDQMLLKDRKVFGETNYDFEVVIVPSSKAIDIKIVYNIYEYDGPSIQRLMGHFNNIINAFIINSDQPLSTINYVSKEEELNLLEAFNDTKIDYPKDKTIVDLFEEQVAKTPNNSAVIFEDTVLTYHELNARSNQFAAYLKLNRGVEPNDIIGVQLERSEWPLIAILAVLKLGGAYVPIELDYSTDRLNFILNDVKCKLCIDEVELEQFKKRRTNYSNLSPERVINEAGLAYVIYTSGSTGEPKGVAISHRALANYLNWALTNYGEGISKKLDFGWFTPLSFDLTVTSLYLPLISGGKLNVYNSQTEIATLLKAYFESEITCVKLTPAHISMLSVVKPAKTCIKLAIVGGDKLTNNQVEILRALNPKMRIYNEYGPTESTVGCVVKEIVESDEEILIGKPIANTEIYIINKNDKLNAVGVVGEILIGGIGLSQGYLNKEVLNKEKFIENPFKLGERLYKTGDLGRWNIDGNIEYLGRLDDQVKVRGYRIELLEIEYALLKHQELKDVAVLTRTNASDEVELVAYLTVKRKLVSGEIRSFLEGLLPSYMIPNHFVQLEKMPLTANGKLDKKALPDWGGYHLDIEEVYLAPRNKLEKRLVEIWQEVLDRDGIGINDDFVDLGGHSLKAMRLCNAYRKQINVKVGLMDVMIRKTIASHAELLHALKEEQFVQIPKVPKQDSYPISDAQRRLWILSQFEEGSVAYNIPGSTYLNKNINVEHFKKAIDAVICRHEVLRTVLKEDQNGILKQWVLEKGDLDFEIACLDFRNEKNKDKRVKQYVEDDAYKAFDLENGPLLRAALLQMDEGQYIFYYNMHHIISDGWSMEVLTKDVLAYYEAFSDEKEVELPILEIQYKDYATWQLHQLEEDSFDVHRQYWLTQLAGELPVIDLPFSGNRPIIKTNKGRGLGTFIDAETTHKLKVYSQNNGGTLFISLLAVWNVLMQKYTNQNDIIIGTPVAGRGHADLENQIGFYVNTLVLRNQVNKEETFTNFYQNLKKNTLESFAHQIFPFDRLVEELNLNRVTSRSAIFDVMLTLQNSERKEFNIELTQEQINQIRDKGNDVSKFDLELTFQEMGPYLSFDIIYNPDVYDQDTMGRLLKNYKKILSEILENSNEKISELDGLTKDEKEKIIEVSHSIEVDYSDGNTIVELFYRQVQATPNSIAIEFDGTQLTYLELNEQSNQLAHYLIKNHHIQINDLVSIKLERSHWVLISMLGIMKSGGVYVPIDLNYPQARIDYIQNNSESKICIDENELQKFLNNQSDFSNENPPVELAGENLAYIIYTSGSTGQPKGVMIEHQSIVNTLKAQIDCFEVDPESIGLQFASFSFDGSVSEIFIILLSGGKLSVISEADRKDPKSLVDFINQRDINIAMIPQSYLSKIDFNEIRPLKKLITGGEVANAQKAIEFLDFGTYYNAYGPTEASICGSILKLEKGADVAFKNMPIGKPISNVNIYILDESNQLMPYGAIGEICIGGKGVARSYLNRSELSAEKFISNPFKAGDRLYKTGDLGKWLQDGNLEFIGRKDDQVKLRGYRIELGEIEQALLSNESINAAVVLAKLNVHNDNELVAYLTADQEQDENKLRMHLNKLLPEYMIPTHFVQMEELPITINGKIDKKSLPSPEGIGVKTGTDYVAPISDEEKALVSVWQDVLKREKIGVKDSFYNLGGDSIKSIQVVSRMKEQGFTLRVENILRTPLLGELAQFVERSVQIVDQSEVEGKVELTPIQSWFFESDEINVHHHYNQSVLLKSHEAIDRNILEQCISDLTIHHDALRMVYNRINDEWQQVNKDTKSKNYTLDFYDLQESDDIGSEISAIGENLQSSINLSYGPLFKVAHFRLTDGDFVGLILHHLVVDGVSWRILLEDLSSLYTSYTSGKKNQLTLKTDSFQKWASAQREYANSRQIKQERIYWEELSSQKISGIPQDKSVQSEEMSMDSSASFFLDEVTTELLQTKVHHVYNTEINDVLLTGLGLAINEVFGVNKTVLKMEGHGREDIIERMDITRTVGWFTTVYPHVLAVSSAAQPLDCLIGVKGDLRKVPNKGIGYGILKYLTEEGIEGELKPEIIFNYLGDFGANVSNEGGSLFEYAGDSFGSEVSKLNRDQTVLNVSGILVKGKLNMSVRYSMARFKPETINKLSEAFEKHLKVLIERLSQEKGMYLTTSDLSFKGLSTEELSSINSDNLVEDIYELSPLQEGIYYHWLIEGTKEQYFEQMSYRIRIKALEIDKMKLAYDALIARHSVLRTSFTNEYADCSLQIVRKRVPSYFTHESIIDKSEKVAYLNQIKEKDRKNGFDLTGYSQMRMHVVELAEGEYEFIWSHHHILMDGWCMSILINDFNELLSAEMTGSEISLSSVKPYSHYINWLRTVDKKSSLEYWGNYLENYSQIAEVPFIAAPASANYVEASAKLHIKGELFNRLVDLCNGINITQNTFIQGIWGYLLGCYNNTKDVVFGTIVSGRPAGLKGVEDMVGLFINTIPVRVNYESHDTPVQFLKELQERSIQTTAHHYINLSEVQAQSDLGMNLIDHIMIFENFAEKEIENEGVLNSQKEEGISVESMEVFERTNYDLNIVVIPGDTFLSIEVIYNSNFYESQGLEYVIKHIENSIHNFIDKPNDPLNNFVYLSSEEKKQVLLTFNDNEISYPENTTLIDLFEAQVQKTPESIALTYENVSFTYQELNAKANQLAHYLQREYDILPNDLVGIKQQRGEWMVVSIFAVLKAGGACVPIDTDFPKDRIDFIENDTACKVSIGSDELNKFKARQQDYDTSNLAVPIQPDNTAYVIYTSGSAGLPKGVLITHENLVIKLFEEKEILQVDHQMVTYCITNYVFDSTFLEIILPLIIGGRVHMPEHFSVKDNNYTVEQIIYRKANILQGTPTYFAYLLSEISTETAALLNDTVKIICAGGESLNANLTKKIKELLPSVQLNNQYGPTEITIDGIVNEDILTFESNNIGKPLGNTKVYIVNEALMPVPVHVHGEILLAGPSVTPGYLNREDLTKEKFIVNPFKQNELLYRTGDIGKWLPDGAIEFIGRKDDQIKIRGHRVEIGEIEQSLSKVKGIVETVVVAVNVNKDKGGAVELELVAYFTASSEQIRSDLRKYLLEFLPKYMIPAYFVQLEKMPRTNNNKIDKKRLPNPKGLLLESGVEYVAPRNDIEENLVKIWEKILEKEKIGIKDDFFDLGGHSLKVVQVLSKIQKTYDVKIEMSKIFELTTVEQIADFISLVKWEYTDVESEMEDFTI